MMYANLRLFKRVHANFGELNCVNIKRKERNDVKNRLCNMDMVCSFQLITNNKRTITGIDTRVPINDYLINST